MSGSFRQLAPGRIQMREGGGCVSVFGLPFFAAGVFTTLVGLHVLPLANASEVSDLAWVVLLLVGLIFTLVGGALVFGRSWTTLDSTQGTVIKERGLLVPMRSRTHRIDDYTAVMFEFIEGDSDTADRYPVSLKSRSGANLQLSSPTQYAEGRACAVEAARHLRFDIEDATSDHPVRLSADQADVPLQHRLRLEHAQEERVERPPTARSEVSEESGGVRIVIPMARRHPAVLAVTLIPVAITFVVLGPLGQFFRQTHTPNLVGWIFQGFLILMFSLMPAIVVLNGLLRSRRGRIIVTISTSGLRVQERGAWRTKAVASFDASDIMDVDCGTAASMLGSARRAAEQQVMQSGRTLAGAPSVVGERTGRVIAALSQFAKGRGITVKTRQGLTTFGQGLVDDEIRYLHSVVRRALATADVESKI